ncbi:transposase family protein (plasmid) [Streptomyces sp. NBC_01431]
MCHRLAVVLALTACAVLAGATSLLAVGEWIADAPAYVLEQVGADPDPLLPRRVLAGPPPPNRCRGAALRSPSTYVGCTSCRRLRIPSRSAKHGGSCPTRPSASAPCAIPPRPAWSDAKPGSARTATNSSSWSTCRRLPPGPTGCKARRELAAAIGPADDRNLRHTLNNPFAATGLPWCMRRIDV